MAPAPHTAPRYPAEARHFHAYLMAGRRRRRRLGRVRQHHDGSFYLDLRPYGRVWSLLGQGFESRRDAQALLRKIHARIDQGHPPDVAIAPYLAASNRTAKVATHYAAWLERRRREAELGRLSHNTVAGYARYAREGGELDFWAAHTIYDVDAAGLEDWTLWLAERGLKPKTVWNVLGAFRAFLRTLARRGELDTVPVFPAVPLEHSVPRVLTVEEQARVLAAIPAPARGAHLILATMGLRPSEVRALQRADYSPARGGALGRLRISRARQGNAAGAPLGATKTRRERVLPVPEVVSAWIDEHVPAAERLRAPEAPLVPNPRTGLDWSHPALYGSWLRGCKVAGVPPIALYNGTKHSCATAMLERSGGNLEAVAKMLGHTDSRTTRRYAVVGEDTLVSLFKRDPGGDES